MSEPDLLEGVQVIRARGKDTIASLVKILNHFDSRNSVLHGDRPLTSKRKKEGELKKNKAWSSNEKIIEAVRLHKIPDKVRLLASVPNFEEAYSVDNYIDSIKANLEKHSDWLVGNLKISLHTTIFLK